MIAFTNSLLTLTGNKNSNDTMFTIKYIIVVTVFLFLLWGLSRMVTKRHYATLSNRNIKVIERIAISNDKFMYLIELDGIHYLIGSDKSGMTVIDKREHLNIEISKKIEPQPGAFFEQLKKSISNRETENRSKDDTDV